MLQEGVRGNKRSKEEEVRIMSDIQKLLPHKNDDEIMEILGLQIQRTIDTKPKSIKRLKRSGRRYVKNH